MSLGVKVTWGNILFGNTYHQTARLKIIMHYNFIGRGGKKFEAEKTAKPKRGYDAATSLNLRPICILNLSKKPDKLCFCNFQ